VTALISALMVTRDRARLAARSIACLAAQTWPRLELVVVDDGSEDYAAILDPYRARMKITHLRIPHEPARRLGALRNIALDQAQGEYLAQWDDDEWYHPTRLERQVAFIEERALDAVLTYRYLMHVDAPGFTGRVYRGRAPGGMPGSLVHRPTALRYPNVARSEDLAFADALARAARVGCMTRDEAHLIVRCYHGRNTWEREHFERRLWRTPRDKLDYLIARYIRGDVFRHPAFALAPQERASAARFLEDSRALGLVGAGGA